MRGILCAAVFALAGITGAAAQPAPSPGAGSVQPAQGASPSGAMPGMQHGPAPASSAPAPSAPPASAAPTPPAPTPSASRTAASGVAAQDAPSTREYRDAMMRMHGAMDIPYTGDPDRDFVAGMIPHHQGAIEMAQTELRHGHDPQLRRLARDIVAAQDKEVAFMRRWLAAHRRAGAAAPSAGR